MAYSVVVVVVVAVVVVIAVVVVVLIMPVNFVYHDGYHLCNFCKFYVTLQYSQYDTVSENNR